MKTTKTTAMIVAGIALAFSLTSCGPSEEKAQVDINLRMQTTAEDPSAPKLTKEQQAYVDDGLRETRANIDALSAQGAPQSQIDSVIENARQILTEEAIKKFPVK